MHMLLGLRNYLPSYPFASSTSANGAIQSSLVPWASLPGIYWTDAGLINVSLLPLLAPCVIVSSQVVSGATLTLHDERGREAGSLVVQLLDTTAQGPKAAVDSAIRDVEQRLPTSPPIPEPVQNATDSVAAVQDLGSNVVNSLKQVVDRSRIVVDFVDKTAKVHVAPR